MGDGFALYYVVPAIRVFLTIIPIYGLLSIRKHKLQFGKRKLRRYVLIEQIDYVKTQHMNDHGVQGDIEFNFIDVETGKHFMLKRYQFTPMRIMINRPHIYLVTFKGNQILNMKHVFENYEDYQNDMRIKNPKELADTPGDRFNRLLLSTFLVFFIGFSQWLFTQFPG